MFDSQLSIRAVSPTMWELTAPLVWTGTKGDTFTVPASFETDLASVPRFMLWRIPSYGVYARAAVLHDYLLVHLVNHPEPALRVTSRDADGIFRRVMHDLGTPWATRWVMWTAVRWGALFNPKRARGRAFAADLPRVLAISLACLPIDIWGALGALASLTLGLPLAPFRPRPVPSRSPLERI